MYMPISKWLLPLGALSLVAACSGGSDGGEALEKAEEQAAQQADDDGRIECALAGSSDFKRVCETERIAGPDGQILVIRHPDGGFRRFRILTDGRGLTPAEGADPTSITVLNDGKIELKSGDDLYRLPAKVKSSEPEAAESGAPAKDAG